ncbi:MAG: UxaA family hydrolase, partial [Saprospiraceae bacterium]|nr:UxaA family hydrolase [Saprospiraceae bacterium]
MAKVLKIHPDDNVWVALESIKAGNEVALDDESIKVIEDIDIKHKLAIVDIDEGDFIRMYGTIVGVAKKPIFRGMKITTENTRHHTAPI